jgi:cell division septation protein DedD
MASARTGGMSAGQVVLVTFGFLLASFLVFIFGMWVGKDIAERRLAQEERVFRAPISRPTASAEVAAAPPTLPAQPVSAATPAPVFQLPGEARTATPLLAPPTPTATLNLVVLSPAPTAARPQPTLPPLATIPGAVDEPTPPADEWADAGWTVQVTATTDPAGAEAIAARLRSRGYDAYTIKAPARGQIWHRVRVGRFATKAEAQTVEQRLKTVEKLTGAFVTAR